ncbi:MAG: hypothetical protein HY458_01885 [Parcubacteria group bacterium]|nr:hypothetical protein [Parcubacteria group bacterium]
MKQSFLIFFAISFAILAYFLFGNGVFRASPLAEALAQEFSDELVCQEKEIPVGEVVVQSGDLVRQVGNALHSMRTNYLRQKTAVDKLLELPDRCNVNACRSSCTPEVVGSKCDGKTDEKGKCQGTSTPIYACRASACAGSPCPTSEIQDQVAKIIAAHESTVQANGMIAAPFGEKIPSPFVTAEYCGSQQCAVDYGPFGCQQKCQKQPWREHILLNLKEARQGLEACVTPANFYDTGESEQDVDILISCQEARFEKVLSEKQEQCFNNNFFCCTIR